MKILLTALLSLISLLGLSQTLFYYGNDSVSAQEFLKAYHKNNTSQGSQKAFRDYLDLYISSRLKIREAIARHYDTLPQLKADLENLRQQILPSFIVDKESINRLMNQAYDRSQKDIHLQHIFISFTHNGTYDTIAAKQKLAQVEKNLHTLPFSDLAKAYSDDPSAKINGGDLGYITVFTLPYELENLAYSTQPGKTSSAYRSKAGYHIFKNLGERKALGRVKVAQILLAFPPDADASAKEAIHKKADSIYKVLVEGADFARLASQNSNDIISLGMNGQMPEIQVGQYDPVFENAVYSLSRDGELSKPFLTQYGYHIVKRITREPAFFSKTNEKAMEDLKHRVEQSDRINFIRMVQADHILKQSGFKQANFREQDLWAYTDSALNFMKPATPVLLKADSPLFTIGSHEETVADWINYAQTYRYKPDGSGLKSYPDLWNEYVHASALNLYQAHLEDFNETFRQQINEFKEGNLFFEIMQRQIWGPAQSDSAALLAYYRHNWTKYIWKESAEAIVFYVNDPAVANTFWSQVKKAPQNWHKLVDQYSEKVAADSGRFELAQLPNPTNTTLQPGMVTTQLVNQTDKTISFAYILKLYGTQPPQPRTFAEAKTLVVNDFQNDLEKEWITILKKKYPIVINQNVLNKLIQEKKYL